MSSAAGARSDEGSPRTESTSAWPRRDRIALALCWAAGIALCALAAAIVLYMLVRGLQHLSLALLVQSPSFAADQTQQGGFLDPIVGTVILAVLGTAIALPVGVATAVWLSEYGRPAWLARAVESGVEVVAGTPSIVLAIFGLVLFTQFDLFALLSFKPEDASPFGRSFLTAGLMMSLIALPLVVGATRESLQAIPAHLREASYALGKTKVATIRRVLLPSARPGIATGGALGLGRIAGDTAIVVILLGATLTLQPLEGQAPGVGLLRGTGSTLTSYVYNNTVGEGNAETKAYAAAFVLLAIVVGLNFLVDLIRRDRRGLSWTAA